MVAHTKHGHPLTFKHPAVQSACMFAGEFCCLIIYAIIHLTKRHPPPPVWSLSPAIACGAASTAMSCGPYSMGRVPRTLRSGTCTA